MTPIEQLLSKEQIEELFLTYAQKHPEEVKAVFEKATKEYFHEHSHPSVRDTIKTSIYKIVDPLIEQYRDELELKVKAKFDTLLPTIEKDLGTRILNSVQHYFDYGAGKQLLQQVQASFVKLLKDKLNA